MAIEDSWDDEWSDDDYDVDSFDDDESETVECPNCGADIYEDVDRCPVCGDFVVHSSAYVWQNRPTWWVVLGLIGILAVIVALAF